MIQNFLFHRVLGEVKIIIYPELFVSSLSGRGEGIAGITDRCLFWFFVWGWGGLLRAQRWPRQRCHFTEHFYVAFSKEIWCMPLQMPHYSYDKQVWK